MKRFYLLMLALLTLTLQAATVKIGYYKSDGDYFWAYDGFGQPPVDMKFGAAIRITPDMYANYLGADIKGIRIGWSNPDYFSPCTIFMRSELNSKENILTGSGTLQFEKSSQPMMGKYTTIYFDNADGMKLTEDLGTFYVGYYAEKVKQGTSAIATSYPGGQAGSAYLWGDIESNYDADGNEIWEDDSDKATLCVDLIVEGTFTNKVQPLGLITYPTITEGKADDGLLSIKNCGTNSVNKLTLEYKMGDEVKTQTVRHAETCHRPCMGARRRRPHPPHHQGRVVQQRDHRRGGIPNHQSACRCGCRIPAYIARGILPKRERLLRAAILR